MDAFIASAAKNGGPCDSRVKGETVNFTSAPILLATFTLLGAIGALPCIAQTRVASLEDLRGTLAAGDLITIVTADGPVAGQLVRLGDVDLDIRVVNKHTPRDRGPRVVTMAFNAIQSLERRPDTVRNGAAMGAVIGAGFGGAMFTYAFVIDRNEMDEWAPVYAGGAAVSTGIGALIGWAIDAARSKPHITFKPSPQKNTKVSVQPVYLLRRGIVLAVSF